MTLSPLYTVCIFYTLYVYFYNLCTYYNTIAYIIQVLYIYFVFLFVMICINFNHRTISYKLYEFLTITKKAVIVCGDISHTTTAPFIFQ